MTEVVAALIFCGCRRIPPRCAIPRPKSTPFREKIGAILPERVFCFLSRIRGKIAPDAARLRANLLTKARKMCIIK